MPERSTIQVSIHVIPPADDLLKDCTLLENGPKVPATVATGTDASSTILVSIHVIPPADDLLRDCTLLENGPKV